MEIWSSDSMGTLLYLRVCHVIPQSIQVMHINVGVVAWCIRRVFHGFGAYIYYRRQEYT